MKAGAGILCAVCHARPFPQLSLPEAVREEHDLLKLAEHVDEKSGETKWLRIAEADDASAVWYCPRHRRALGRGHYAVVDEEMPQ
jgi:hypothetical protein